jgi:hypothetical protein
VCRKRDMKTAKKPSSKIVNNENEVNIEEKSYSEKLGNENVNSRDLMVIIDTEDGLQNILEDDVFFSLFFSPLLFVLSLCTNKTVKKCLFRLIAQ